MKPENLNIIHKPKDQRFVTTVDGKTAFIEYVLHRESIALMKTVVPPPIEGQGIATALVKHVFAYAKEKELAVKPYCSFVVDFVNKNPEYEEQLQLD